MSETTYWVIVIAALAGALAIWLLTRETPKPAKRAKPEALPPLAASTGDASLLSPAEDETSPLAGSAQSEAVAEAEAAAEDEALASQPPAEAGAAKPPARAPKPATDGHPDALTRLKGLGPKAAARLAELGITRFDQIAAWSEEDVARIAPQLGNFRDRVVRDRWVEQAGHLAGGDTAGFETKFGKLG